MESTCNDVYILQCKLQVNEIRMKFCFCLIFKLKQTFKIFMYFQIVHIIVMIYVIFNVKVILNIILTWLF